MEFEFDPLKSTSNLEKHEISFIEAQKIWLDPDRIEIPARKVDNETRFAVIGKIESKCWIAVITYRETVIRLISVRTPTKKELRYYDEGN